MEEKILAIGSEYHDENGNKNVPIYFKNRSTGLMTAKIVTIPKVQTEKQMPEDNQTQ